MIRAERGDGYVLDDDPVRLDRNRVEQWLSVEAYWSRGRTRDEIDRSIAASWPFGVYDADDSMVAFARVLTDHVTFAWICDVFVDSAARGQGIGTWMMAELVSIIEATGVKRQVLATSDAHEIYASAGFAPLGAPQRWMEIDRRDAR